MKIAVIPARGGSKRIPKKNIKEFFGKPIIAYSIETALNSQMFDKVVVSTDDEEIAKTALSYGATVPFMRPKSLSDDFTPTIPVIAHAISELEKSYNDIKEVCCIYATAPFTRSEDIKKAYEKLIELKKDYSFAATSFAYPIQRALHLENETDVAMFYPEHFNTRSQDLKVAYHDAGQFYWGTKEAWLKGVPIFSKNSTFIKLPRYLVQDIDTLEDWKRAELMYQIVQKSNV
jgi:pseudaminic acid cytidylyltransferase